MIYITCGTCGTSKGYKTRADGALSLPASEEARLVARGVAAYVTAPIIGGASNAPATPPSGGEPEGRDPDTSGEDPSAEGGEDDTGPEAGEADSEEVKRLERMSKNDLVQMAQDMGVDISGAKNNHDRAVLIAAAGEQEGGDAPPDLGAGDIVQ